MLAEKRNKNKKKKKEKKRVLTLGFFSHCVENVGSGVLTWIEIYKSGCVADVSLTQWLTLTPAELVARGLRVPVAFVEGLKREKQASVAA